MTTSGLALEIYTNIGSPTDLSEAAVQYWVRTNIVGLNAKTFSSFSLVSGASNGEQIVNIDGVPIESGCQWAVYKKMYEVYRWDTVIRQKLTSLDSDSLIEVTDNGSTIVRVNKNEVIKVLKDMKNQDIAELNFLIEDCNSGRGGPGAIHGDDTVPAYYTNN